MKIGIFTNFTWPAVGGSEKVVQEISERLVKKYGHKVYVFGGMMPLDTCPSHNGVQYLPDKEFAKHGLSELERWDFDHIFVYSDNYKLWPLILDSAEKIRARVSIAMVGAYATRKKPDLLKKIKSKVIEVIVHSSQYNDYDWLCRNGVTPMVIPNGISLDEFDSCTSTGFRTKLGIKTRYMLLYVANFFPGKGQEYFLEIMKRYREVWGNDITTVFVANHSDLPIVNQKMSMFKRLAAATGCEHRLAFDLPRSEVIQAFKEADLLCFASQKEVAPLVLIEAMAANLHWLSGDVGNAKELLAGGEIVPATKWADGNVYWDENAITTFAASIHGALNRNYKKEKAKCGRELVELVYNWDKIVEQYNAIFSK